MRKYLNKYTLPKLWRILFFRCHLCGKEGLEPYNRVITFFNRRCLCRDCYWHTLDNEDDDLNEDGEIINFHEDYEYDADEEEEDEEVNFDGEDPEVPDEE